MTEGEKILSQREVDALLSAIDSGEVQVFPQSDAAVRAVPYDFKRPERVASEQLRAISTLHEVYARNLQTALSGMLRTVVDVKVASVEQLTFLEFINALPNPTVFTVLACEPLVGPFLFEVSPIIAFPIIERLLGSGKVGASQPERALTRIEWKLMDSVIARAVDLMRDVWAPIVAFNVRVTAREANPQIMQVFSPNEAVIAVTVEISMGDHKGFMNLCLPVLAIEAYLGKISSHTWFSSRKSEELPSQESVISEQLAPAPIRATVYLPPDVMLLKDVERLRPGDVLVTNHAADVPVVMALEGRPKFHVVLRSFKDHKAVKVVGKVVPSQEVFLGRPQIPLKVQKGEGAGTEASTEIPEGILKMPLMVVSVLAEKPVCVKEILEIKVGQVIEFQKRVDEPVTLLAGGRPIASGVTVKVGERFGFQVASVGGPRETVAALGP